MYTQKYKSDARDKATFLFTLSATLLNGVMTCFGEISIGFTLFSMFLRLNMI